MRSIKFDQLGRKAPVAPATLVAPAATTLTAGPPIGAPDQKPAKPQNATKKPSPSDGAAVAAGSPKP